MARLLQNFQGTITKIANYLLNDPIRIMLATCSFFIIFNVVASWDYYKYNREEFIIQLLAEMHGLVMEVLIVGILAVIITRAAERKRTIENCKQQIEDWKDDDSPYGRGKVLSNVKMLSRYKVVNLQLRDANLAYRKLKGILLTNAELIGLNAMDADFSGADLSHSKLMNATFRGADLEGCKLMNCYGKDVDFTNANLTKADFENSELMGAKFPNAMLNYVNFKNTNLANAVFKDATLLGCDFRGATKLSTGQLVLAKKLTNCLMDDDLQKKYNLLIEAKEELTKISSSYEQEHQQGIHTPNKTA